jgi:hypothetical protein
MKKTITLFAIIFSLLSCSKSDDTPATVTYQEENPLSGFLTSTGFSQNATTFVNTGAEAFGYSFIPKVKGKIKAILVKLPSSDNNVVVKIWDKATGTAVYSTTINVATAGTEISTTIPDLELTKNHEYVISMGAENYLYRHTRADQNEVSYPVTSGNITITGGFYRTGFAYSLDVLPETNGGGYVFMGDINFKFQQTE